MKTKLGKERTKETQQENWSIEWEDSQEENKDKQGILSHFRKYTIENQKIVLKQPMREIIEEKISYLLR